jgi:hypothetical protein
MAAAPVMATTALAARAFQQRVVRYLTAEAGVTQFLDIGAGLAMSGSTHEIAQSIVPRSRVVYVDNDPVVLSHARALLKSAPGGGCGYLDCDVRDVPAIVFAARATLDFGQPIAVMLANTLAFASDGTVAVAVSALKEAVPPGSYVAISHLASDADPDVRTAIQVWNSLSAQRLTLRSRAEAGGLVSGLDLVPPGLVPVSRWGQETAAQRGEPEVPMYGVVARKPVN